MNANNAIPTFPNILTVWLKQLGIAALYVPIGYVIRHNFVSQSMVSVVWPGSGQVLAVLLIGMGILALRAAGQCNYKPT